MKKIQIIVQWIFILVLLILSINAKLDLDSIRRQNDYRTQVIVEDHLLSLSLFEVSTAEEILQSNSSILLIQEIVDGLNKATITSNSIFKEDSILTSNIYSRYSYQLKQYQLELLETGQIEDKQTFGQVLTDIYKIKSWLENKYHNGESTMYDYEEFKESLQNEIISVEFK